MFSRDNYLITAVFIRIDLLPTESFVGATDDISSLWEGLAEAVRGVGATRPTASLYVLLW